MKTRITIILGIATLILGSVSVVSIISSDNKAPEIIVPETEIIYMEDADHSSLLNGVKATDNRDGDISGQVRIYDVAVIDGEKQALVTYAVYDSSYNLGKATKVVSYMKAGAVNDGDINEAEGDAINNEDIDATGEANGTTQEVVESIPEGFDDPELVSTGAPVIRLVTHYETIEVGGYFYSMDYVEDIVDDEDDIDTLYANTYMDGYYDTEVEGEYELTFYCVDTEGNISNKAKLMLTVGEGNNE